MTGGCRSAGFWWECMGERFAVRRRELRYVFTAYWILILQQSPEFRTVCRIKLLLMRCDNGHPTRSILKDTRTTRRPPDLFQRSTYRYRLSQNLQSNQNQPTVKRFSQNVGQNTQRDRSTKRPGYVEYGLRDHGVRLMYRRKTGDARKGNIV
jgi:hypothetical protein